MTALILGLGYLGAALARDLLAAGRQIVGVDNGFATDWPALERLSASSGGRLALLRGDLRRAEDVTAAFERAAPVEAVYLLAAQASAHPDAAPAEYTEETNLRGPRLVFEAALNHGAPPVVYGSSFHVYGPGLSGTVGEDRPSGPQRDLAHLSKLYVEALGQLYAGEHQLPVAPVRLGIVYGVGPVMKRDRRFVTVPHAFALRAIAGEALQVHASGLQPLAFIHLDDATAALRLAAPEQGYAPANAVGEVASVVDVAQHIRAASATRGVSVDVTLPDAAGPETAAFTVTSRLTAAGWQPTHTLAATIPHLLDYYAGPGGRQ